MSGPAHLPADHYGLTWLAGSLGPAERRCLREIVEMGDVFDVRGTSYLVAPLSPDALEALSCFESEGADLEPPEDGEPDSDMEPEHYRP
jgi:hypothetical protein